MNIMGGDSRIHKQKERRMLSPTVGYRTPMTPESLCPPFTILPLRRDQGYSPMNAPPALRCR